jgi:hypothetical protein
MEPNEDSNAHWLYHRCAAARTTMQTPLSTLQLSTKILQFIKSMEKDDAEDLSQMQLFEMLKYDCIAQKRDISFMYDLSERALELKMDVEISEEALGLVASNTVRNGSSVETAPLEEIDNDYVAGDAVAFGMDDHLSSSGADYLLNGERSADNNAAPMMEYNTAKCTTSDVNPDDESQEHINFDELHCFQLRTRVLGLNIPTFNELWRYLQAAGWTYSNGNYHVPKALERSNDRMIYYDTESTMKRMYKHFSLDDTTCDQHPGQQSDAEEFDGEEGPETFDNPNDLVAYLDEYCMTDYRATPPEIHAQQIAQHAKSKAYRRRNIQLRFDLLEVAYRDRVRKRREAEMVASQSKYGHNHRPCDVCFKGASSLYPRVACRKCGLIVHTHCYGLLDHGQKDGNARSRAEVDEKGYFTCDVCMYSLVDDSVNQKVRYHASESSGWRIHTHPNAVCPLCVKNTIIGGMIRVTPDSDDDGGARIANAKNRKRKSRRSSEQSELWVHLFCINALPSRGGSGVDIRIRDALAISFQIVQETEVRPNCEIDDLSVPHSFS